MARLKLYNELYKFTNEYRQSLFKNLIARFSFKAPSANIADGANFSTLNGSVLYDKNGNIVQNSEVYFHALKSYTGYPNKRIRVCNIPFERFKNRKYIMSQLAGKLYDSITINKSITSTEYVSSLETFQLYPERYSNISLEYIKNLNKTTFTQNPERWVFGIQFTIKEFIEATGILPLIYRNKIDTIQVSNGINIDRIRTFTLNNFYKNIYGSNIKICLTSKNHLEIEFMEEDNNNGIIQDNYYINFYLNSDKMIDMDSVDVFENEINKSIISNSSIWSKQSYDLYTDDVSHLMSDSDSYIDKELIDLSGHYILGYDTKGDLVEGNIMIPFDKYDFIRNGNGDTDLVIKYDDNDKLCGIDKKYFRSYKAYIYKTTDPIKETNELRDILERYNMSYDKLPEYFSKDSTDKNIIEYVPFSLQEILDKKSTLSIREINEIRINNVIIQDISNKNDSNKTDLYFEVAFDPKHNAVMFFDHDGEILIPTIIESDNSESEYKLKFNLSSILDSSDINAIKNIKLGYTDYKEYVKIKKSIYFVYDTNTYFIENPRYDIKSIWVNIPVEKDIHNKDRQYPRYDIVIDNESNEQKFEQSDSGSYINYDGRFIELGTTMTDDGLYYKTKTNEYLLPLNKDIDPSRLAISIESYESCDDAHYVLDPFGPYVYLDKPRYYAYNASNIFDKSGFYVRIDDNIYAQYNEETHSNESIIYRKYDGNQWIVPPYYENSDRTYRKISCECIKLNNIFNFKYDEEIVSIDTYETISGTKVVQNKKYSTKEELIKSVISKKFKYLTYPLPTDRYYKNGDEYVQHLINDGKNDSELYVMVTGTMDDGSSDIRYYNVVDVKKVIKDINEFLEFNRVYKFTLHCGEIVDGGYAETDEYYQILDSGDVSTDEEVEYYDFNFTSPYMIDDDTIKAYRIDSSFSNFYTNTDDDKFLVYDIPHQLIHSEKKLMTFLDGILTDEYVINKHIHSQIFDGRTLLSFSDDPIDPDNSSFTYKIDDDNGNYYYDYKTDTYVLDEILIDIEMDNNVPNLYYKFLGTDEYIDSYDYESYIFDGHRYSVQITGNNTKYYEDPNGAYLGYIDSNGNISYTKEADTSTIYYKLLEQDKYITSDIYDMSSHKYRKIISTVYMCNMRNLILYQNNSGLEFDDVHGIFKIKNSMDSIVYNERIMYKDIYYPPLSTKYMLFFINGRFANPFIKIITPQSFIIENSTFLNNATNGSMEIHDIKVYAYDKYIYNLYEYREFFTYKKGTEYNDQIDPEINSVDYNEYIYNDTLMSDYSDIIFEKYSNNDWKISYKPRDIGYNPYSDLMALYEIFGKFVLNKYDLDTLSRNNPVLYSEIREYFDELFDDDGRMRLSLLDNSTRRKYIY